MTQDAISAATLASFESIKSLNEHGAEYWSARALQILLGYAQWRRFEDAIGRAMISCEQSGNMSGHHFAGVGKMVDLGSGSVREVNDFHLSRFACYLIAQNGDPRKPAIANAQKYFAVQARRQELSDDMAADVERLELRKQAGWNSNTSLARRGLPGCKTALSAFFTMPDIRACMTAWVSMPSGPIRTSRKINA